MFIEIHTACHQMNWLILLYALLIFIMGLSKVLLTIVRCPVSSVLPRVTWTRTQRVLLVSVRVNYRFDFSCDRRIDVCFLTLSRVVRRAEYHFVSLKSWPI